MKSMPDPPGENDTIVNVWNVREMLLGTGQERHFDSKNGSRRSISTPRVWLVNKIAALRNSKKRGPCLTIMALCYD